MARVILHIDLNSYFVSAEIARNQDLKGKEVVISSEDKRSIICCASYEARAKGIKAAMNIGEAYKLSKDIVIVEPDMAHYQKTSNAFFNIIRQITPKVEIASIDECYVDVSDIITKYERPLDLAWYIQTEVYSKLKLPCSIGIANTKYLAKIGSDMRKPMGIMILRKSELSNLLYPKDIAILPGIGKKAAAVLRKNNINIISELIDEKNYRLVRRILGKNSDMLIRKIQGFYDTPLVYNRSLQSISQSKTFKHDVENYDEIKVILKKIVKELSDRAIKKQLLGKHFSITMRFNNYKTIVRSINLNDYYNQQDVLYEYALMLFDQHYQDIPVRLLGVTLGSLKANNKIIKQESLFNPPEMDIISILNEKLKSGKLIYAKDLKQNENK